MLRLFAVLDFPTRIVCVTSDLAGVNQWQPNSFASSYIKQARGASCSQRGMTLIELLVSLVILSFVATIMSGAFFQVAQVVRVAENANGQFQLQWVRLHALNDLVGNLVLPEDAERPFIGNSTGFEGFSLSLPHRDWGAVQAFRIKLVPRQSGGMDMTVTAADDKALVLASWDDQVRFEYLAVDGSVQSSWPPFDKSTDVMPSGVVVRMISGGRLVKLAASYTGVRKVENDAANSAMELFGVGRK